MRFVALFTLLAVFLSACGESAVPEIYNENNTNVIDGIVYDINEKPINGIYKIYYPDGTVKMEITGKNGKPEGEGKFYDEKGRLTFTGTFKDGLPDGVMTNYFSNGTIRNEITYVKGVQNGLQHIYNEDGEQIIEMNFENGKAVSGYAVVNGKNIDFTPEELAEINEKAS